MKPDTGVLASLRRETAVATGGLVLATAIAWAYLAMGAGMDMGHAAMPQPALWSFSYALLVWVMWAVMMTAMMLPGAAPAILLFAAINRRRAPADGGARAVTVFGLGYLAAWAAFSTAAVAAQWALHYSGALSGMMAVTSALLGGSLLVAAGVYQLTPLKAACLRRCGAPLFFFARHWRPGTLGAFAMGLHHGLYCLGCCWVLMLLLFYAGVMNMAWIAGLTLYVMVEKLVPQRYAVARGAGLILCVWGLGVVWLALG
ncbi:DUF2182 domain-containing protein [Kaustia mangrovi]|uniref:DUF2182 domain-containing protein n=1 Tax=Kaustia mangrovi TaxID=2593653 RepID=A0A7S8C890_9HYPH|nr:DUF2182 domain-containing protein [Kaustia mangrovi]QPC45079.1 DUF2182 domain-containing protein [Kaustia mangrovi]